MSKHLQLIHGTKPQHDELRVNFCFFDQFKIDGYFLLQAFMIDNIFYFKL